jgi:hypothetical protein
MLVTAALAGAGAINFAQQDLNTANVADAIRLIQNEDDANWCQQQARAATFESEAGDRYCAIGMPKYREPEQAE